MQPPPGLQLTHPGFESLPGMGHRLQLPPQRLGLVAQLAAHPGGLGARNRTLLARPTSGPGCGFLTRFGLFLTSPPPGASSTPTQGKSLKRALAEPSHSGRGAGPKNAETQNKDTQIRTSQRNIWVMLTKMDSNPHRKKAFAMDLWL